MAIKKRDLHLSREEIAKAAEAPPHIIATHPDELPIAMLLRAFRGDLGGTPTSEPYKSLHESRIARNRAITDPADAIRAKCHPDGMCRSASNVPYDDHPVEDCDNIDCPFWAFRMGTNPFYRKR